MYYTEKPAHEDKIFFNFFYKDVDKNLVRTTRFWNNLCNKCPKCHPCLGRPVRKISVTNDHRYAMLNPVISSFTTYYRNCNTHDGCHQWSKNYLPYSSIWVPSSVFSGGSCCSSFRFLPSALQIMVCLFEKYEPDLPVDISYQLCL